MDKLKTSTLQTQYCRENKADCTDLSGAFTHEYVEWLQDRIIKHGSAPVLSDEEINKEAEAIMNQHQWFKDSTGVVCVLRFSAIQSVKEALRKKITDFPAPYSALQKATSSLRANFDLWRKNEIEDGAFSWHINNNLLRIEKIINNPNQQP